MMDSRRCNNNTFRSRHSPAASGPRCAILARARRAVSRSTIGTSWRNATNPHILVLSGVCRNDITDRTPNDLGIRLGTFDQALQLFTYRASVRWHARCIKFPIVRGSTKHSPQLPCTVVARLIVLKVRRRSDCITRDFSVIAQVKDPGNTAPTT